MVQKAVEMGVSRLQPVLTRHGQVARVNLERMRANAVEAAEQCGILSLPEIAAPVGAAEPDGAMGAGRGGWCFATRTPQPPIRSPALAERAAAGAARGAGRARRRICRRTSARRCSSCRNVARLSLGPRILRADTAAVAALAIVQSVLGDWR